MNIIVYIFLFILIIVYLINLFDNKYVETYWMENISDNKSLSEIFIPGTHDSIAYNTNLKFISKCQKLSFQQQLNHGFRLFDIRLSNNLNCNHGPCQCYNHHFKLINFENILNQSKMFLNNHNETIILMIDFEKISKNKKYENIEIFDSKINSILNKFDVYEITNLTKLPLIGDVRKKIVIIKKYKLHLPSQDEWKSINLARKIRFFKHELNNNLILINQLNVAWFPFLWSFILNSIFKYHLVNYLKYPQWFLFDYGDYKLAHLIYKMNF